MTETVFEIRERLMRDADQSKYVALDDAIDELYKAKNRNSKIKAELITLLKANVLLEEALRVSIKIIGNTTVKHMTPEHINNVNEFNELMGMLGK